MKLKCDMCSKKKKYEKNGEPNIYHFTGWIHGEFNPHIHVCKKCSEKYEYSYYFIHIPNVHIKGKELNEC